MAETNKESFPNVTHYTHVDVQPGGDYTHVDVQPGGVNIQNVEHFHQADFLKALGIELEIKNKTTEETPNGRAAQRGPKKQYLFTMDGDPTVENTQVREREKERFLRYLREHKLMSRSLTCNKKDTLNDVVTCFIIEWQGRGMIADEPSGGAIFRFLRDECHLKSDVEGQSYSNEIKERLQDKDYTIEKLKMVREYFNLNNS